MTPRLFEPLELRGLALDNRVVVSPMCQYSGENGHATAWHLMHLGQFLVGGAGLVISEMTNVELRGRISPRCLALHDDGTEAALARVVDFRRRYGRSPLAVQLAHAGRKASTRPPWEGREPLAPDHPLGWETVAPSAIPADDRSPVPRALETAEIHALIEAFAASARRAARAGFEAVELHGAHGYLLHQFLSPLSNRRTDGYGGDRNARMRFALEVFEAVRAAWPEERPLGIRVSATDGVPGGWDVDDTVALGRALAERGCDWIDVSSGGLSPAQRIVPEPGYQVPLARRVREATGLVTMAVGLVTDPRQAEQIVAGGSADLVALARGMLHDPRWTWHAAEALGVPERAELPPQYLRCRPWVQG